MSKTVSSPPETNGGTIKISFSHLSPAIKGIFAILSLIGAVGAAGGGWHLIGQAQGNQPHVGIQHECISKLHTLELSTVKATSDIQASLQKLESKDSRLNEKLERLDKRLEALTKLVAANYLATTAGNPDRKRAARLMADEIKRNPLSVLQD
jgi:hypothetical protein